MLLNDVATYLAAQSTVFTVGTSSGGGNLVKSVMPTGTSAAGTMISLFETAGVTTQFVFSTSTLRAGVAFEQPRLQLLSRSTSYVTARNNAETAFHILDGIANQRLPTSTGPLYQSIVAVQPPFAIGPDENGRHVLSCNFEVRKTTG